MESPYRLPWLAIVVLMACGQGAVPAASDDLVEFSRGRHGGLCPSPDGGGEVCRWEVTVFDDGTWRVGGAPAVGQPSGEVRPDAASELAAVLEGGWSELTERAFEGTCPTAYDGSEAYFMVRRIPQGPGSELADATVREVRSCTYDLEHRGARAVLDRIEELWEEMGLPG